MVDERHEPDFDAHFNGDDYQPARDKERLRGQILRVYSAIKDGRWRTLKQLSETTGDPEASVSAQLRHLPRQQPGALGSLSGSGGSTQLQNYRAT